MAGACRRLRSNAPLQHHRRAHREPGPRPSIDARPDHTRRRTWTKGASTAQGLATAHMSFRKAYRRRHWTKRRIYPVASPTELAKELGLARSDPGRGAARSRRRSLCDDAGSRASSSLAIASPSRIGSCFAPGQGAYLDRRVARGKPLSAIAAATGHSESYVRTRAQLAFLAPAIQIAILDGRQPTELTLEQIVRKPDAARLGRAGQDLWVHQISAVPDLAASLSLFRAEISLLTQKFPVNLRREIGL